MIVIDVLLSVILSGVCVYSIISDIRTGKILNRILVICGFISVALTIIKFIFFSRDDIILFIENAGVIIFISLLWYVMRIWAGGDCKLAIFISLFYPTLFYFDYNGRRFTLWLIIVFAFLIGYIYIIVDSIRCSLKDGQRFDIKNSWLSLKNGVFSYLTAFVYLTALNFIYSVFIYPYFQLNSVIYAIISIVFVYITGHVKVLKKYPMVGLIALADILFMLFTKRFVIVESCKNYVLVLVFLITRVLI